jgi:hypothetical protein
MVNAPSVPAALPMRRPRVRFTVRSMMVVVALAALVIAGPMTYRRALYYSNVVRGFALDEQYSRRGGGSPLTWLAATRSGPDERSSSGPELTMSGIGRLPRRIPSTASMRDASSGKRISGRRGQFGQVK